MMNMMWTVETGDTGFNNASDVKFDEMFCREIFHEICCEIFLKYFKNFTATK